MSEQPGTGSGNTTSDRLPDLAEQIERVREMALDLRRAVNTEHPMNVGRLANEVKAAAIEAVCNAASSQGGSVEERIEALIQRRGSVKFTRPSVFAPGPKVVEVPEPFREGRIPQVNETYSGPTLSTALQAAEEAIGEGE